MLKYKKYIIYSALTLIIYTAYIYFSKKTPDPVLAGVLCGIVTFTLAYIDLRKIKAFMDEIKLQVDSVNSTRDYKSFIESQKMMKERAVNKSFINMINLNIAGAYASLNDRENALKTLEEIHLKDFDKHNLLNGALNKVFTYYRIGEINRANTLYDDFFKKDFKNGGEFFEIMKVLRKNINNRDGIKELSKLNMDEKYASYRPIIAIAKEIIIENTGD